MSVSKRMSSAMIKPYLVGEVEKYPFMNKDPSLLLPPGKKLHPRVEYYAEILSQVAEKPFELEQLPDDPLVLGYLAAYILQVSSDQKQTLLEPETALEFLTNVTTLYGSEIAFLKAMLEHEAAGDKSDRYRFN